MYGILWTKELTSDNETTHLTLAGYDYATLDVYLEEEFTQSRYYREGFRPHIVSVHQEEGRWIC